MPFRPVPALGDAVRNVGIHAVEAEVAAALRRLRDIGFHVVHIDSGLEGVVAPDLGHRIHTLQAIDGLNGGGVVANADAAKTGDVHVWEAAIVGHLRNSLDAEHRGNSKGVCRRSTVETCRMHHAHVHIVGKCGSEDSRIPDRPGVGRQAVVACVGLAHGIPGKVSWQVGVEQAAVIDAEQDVLGTDVGVNTNVPGVGVLVLDGNVAGEIAAQLVDHRGQRKKVKDLDRVRVNTRGWQHIQRGC